MLASGVWKGGFQTVLNDGRNHEITVDLPDDEAGEDAGTSALELSVLSLAGCISTIFTLVARRRRLTFDTLRVDLEAERPRGSPTITGVTGTLHVGTVASVDDVRAALGITMRTCPVGVLFERANIPLAVGVAIEPVAGTGPR